MNLRTRVMIAVACTAATVAVPVLEPARAAVASPSIATFEGGTIDLRKGWGEATACVSDGVSTQCFRTEEELDRAMAAGTAEAKSASTGVVAALLACSSSLRLWSGNSFSGTVLAFTTRGVIMNLSAYGFDNVASSYSVGACNSTFYAGSNGGGGVYPGSTSAGSQSAVMVAGWDNVVSSIYIA